MDVNMQIPCRDTGFAISRRGEGQQRARLTDGATVAVMVSVSGGCGMAACRVSSRRTAAQ